MKNKGCVYLVRIIGLSPVKIGYSDAETPIDRINSFKICAPYGLDFIGFIKSDNAKILETELHKKYSHLRLNGEWFNITREEADKIIELYSEIEDLKEKNKFQNDWMLHKTTISNYTENSDKRQQFYELYNKNKNLNLSKVAKLLGVARQTLYKWIAYHNKI